jgi:hypothetical protein
MHLPELFTAQQEQAAREQETRTGKCLQLIKAILPQAVKAIPTILMYIQVFQQIGTETADGAKTQVGYTNADGTFYWIGTAPTPDSALPFPSQYGYIIGQSFTATTAGLYNFSFAANGDNFFSFFINGSIS